MFCERRLFNRRRREQSHVSGEWRVDDDAATAAAAAALSGDPIIPKCILLPAEIRGGKENGGRASDICCEVL